MASNFRYGVAAFHAAEAGLEQAIENHANNQITATISGTVGDGEFSASITESSGIYTVVSDGTHSPSGAQQQLTIVLSGVVGSTPTIDSWINDE